MTETTLYAHAPCGWRTWTAEGEPVPEHDCPKPGGDAYPVVSLTGPGSDVAFLAGVVLSLDTTIAGSGLGRFAEEDRVRLRAMAG